MPYYVYYKVNQSPSFHSLTPTFPRDNLLRRLNDCSENEMVAAIHSFQHLLGLNLNALAIYKPIPCWVMPKTCLGGRRVLSHWLSDHAAWAINRYFGMLAPSRPESLDICPMKMRYLNKKKRLKPLSISETIFFFFNFLARGKRVIK